MTWEESPKYQKFQAGLLFGFLVLFLVIGIAGWWITGNQTFVIIPACVFAGLILFWGFAALIMVIISKLLKREK